MRNPWQFRANKFVRRYRLARKGSSSRQAAAQNKARQGGQLSAYRHRQTARV